MEKKKIWHSMTPLEWILLGFGVSLAGLLAKRGVNPFLLLGFIFIALFEKYFRKQKIFLSSNLMSMTSGIVIVLAIKLFVIDFLVMKSDALDLNIPKESRIFFQPALFTLKNGDLIIYRPSGTSKSYLAVFRGVENGKYNLFLAYKKQLISSNRQAIRGRIFFVIPHPPENEILNKTLTVK